VRLPDTLLALNRTARIQTVHNAVGWLGSTERQEMTKPSAIAIVGMAGRFPGARDISEFWQNLRDGVESIRSRSNAELLAAGVTPDELASPDYVKRVSVFDDVPMFDASFFGLSPRDASIMDPQHRHFLECAWEALEDAGHPPQRFDGSIGVFAGSGMNNYLIHNLLANRRLLESTGLFQLKQTGNDKDVLATRVSYQFDLHGPSINVQTACSTSLVAVHLACQSLLNYECDLALAGGVTIEIPHGRGYIYREGEILSRDGHCRAFDATSSGTVFGSGLGIVVLRRLEDALEDRDHIRAVILGSAVNNDGARKVGYLAPSVEGQAEVIAEALDFASIDAADISYVETHGTGTVVGDPIEVRALTQAFRKFTAGIGYCGIGSLKTNVGHLDAAAGVASLMKTVLALEHGQMPASLHFQNLNPHIELKGSPFFVNSQLKDWPFTETPRRAGVTSLGIGGTNAHVVLEEAPPPVESQQTKPYQLLVVSAKTDSAAERAFTNLATHVHAHPELRLADVAFTCQVGRHAFPHRRALVVEDTREAVSALAEGERKSFASGLAAKAAPSVVFMFSGQGSQYVNMGRNLYENELIFRETLDLCAQQLMQPLALDLRQALYPPEEEKDAAVEKLNQTWLTQPALFSIEYALARWWMSLGVEPKAMVGHSIGEYVAACLAGVFSLEDALAIAAFRGRLMYDLPSGSMLAVPLAESDLHLSGTLCLAAINNPDFCVVSGPTPEIAALEESLAKQSVSCRRLLTSHAFHSEMMDPILGAFEGRLQSVELKPPRMPYLSNVSGTWIKPEEATNPGYWARHLRQTVRFSDCLAELFREPDRILIEVGPGNALTFLARQQASATAKIFQSLPHPREATSDLRCALHTLGQVWISGVSVDWPKLHPSGSVHRVPLPTYPFEHKKCWIEPDRVQFAETPPHASRLEDDKDLSFYRRVWRAAPAVPASTSSAGAWIVFNDSLGLGDQVAAKLRADKQDVILVAAGSSYQRSKKDKYTIRPGVRDDYDALIADSIKSGYSPRRIFHLWSVEGAELPLAETMDRSFYSPLYLAQALANQDIADIDIALVSNRMQQVSEEPVRNPARAVLLGPARVIPKELPGITCCSIDVGLESGNATECAAQIVSEMASIRDNATVAFRGSERFVEMLDPLNLPAAPERRRLQPRGVYVITGGLGGIGLVVAEHLAREFNARLVLVTRSPLPPEAEWEATLNDRHQTGANKQRIRKLLEIRAIAGGLLVAQGDVTNLDQMRDIVAQARQRYGKIDGVFHAAGILDDGPLMLKTAESAARVLDPKVRGTLVLEEALRDAPLSCFVLFSSISSIFPPAGQVDYAAANAFLDAFALSRKDPVTVINWGAWREVGMGARSASPHPLLDERLLATPQEIVYSSHFSQQQQGLLSEHRLKSGKALIPGTGYLEMAAAAFERGSMHGPIEFQDVFFLAPLTFDASESREVRVQLKREQEAGPEKGGFRFSIFARAGKWVEHSTGRIEPCLTRPVSQIDRAAIAARCHEREVVFDEQHRTKQERYLDFGSRWHSLKRLHIGKHEGLAELALDDRFSADSSAYRMHPAMLDLATGCSLYLTDGYESSDDLYFPFSYKKLYVYRTLPIRFFSHIRPRRENLLHGEVETFDITLFDEQDQVLVEIEGFAMRRIADPAKTGEENTPARDAALPGGDQPIESFYLSGISPHEGARALTRILLARTPLAVVAVSQSLEDLDKQNETPSPRTIDAAAPSAAPTSEGVEGTLASWWQDLLGVEQVGLDDDFFGLGGHSLVGVRLFAKIKKTYQVDFELAVLFEARTVRQLADAIRKAQQPDAAEQGAWSQNRMVPIAHSTTGAPVPSFGQERLWLLEQIESGTAQYNISFTLRLEGTLDFAALKSALSAVVQRHETLRTRYIHVEGQLQLEISAALEVLLPVTDFSGIEQGRRKDLLSAALHAEANRPIVLDRDPVIRAALYRMDECEHVLQLTVHHIASDGWSMGVLFRDFAAFYDAGLTGAVAQLPELPIAYSDYARWQREQFAGPERERLISYWKDQVKGSSFALQLPTDRPRPALQTFCGAVRQYLLSTELATAIREFCLRERVTPFMVALAALYAVLARYSGQDDILIGSPIAARSRSETQDLVGFFTNTVILRGKLDGDPTFHELLQRVRQTALEAYAHQDLPLEMLIDKIRPGRDLSRSALFQVMLIFQNWAPPSLELHGLEVSAQVVRTDTSKFDFTIELRSVGETIEGVIEYNTDLFDAGTIDRLWGHLTAYLHRAIAAPEQRAATVSLLTSRERQQVLVEWNATERAYPRETSLAELVEAQVERTPDAIAVVYGEQRLTYRELNERANQLAHELCKHGAGPDQLVGLFVERSIDMVVALLAIVKTGSAYLPLDPLLPAERLGYMLEDSGVRVLVTERSLRGVLPAFAGTTILLDDAGWQANRRDNLGLAVGPEHLAYVIYTSGSTGKPKGVQVPRGALTNLLWSMREWLQLSEHDRLLAVTTISFDIAGADVWLPLLVGAQTVVASREEAADGNALRGLLERHDITFLQATPVTWQLLFDSGWSGKPDLQTVCTGEAMPPEVAAQLVPVVERVWNLYGPTETTIWSTGYRVTDGQEPILIGRPVTNTKCYILDGQGQPVPVGVTGELYIGGDGLARGYLNRPELTAEKFVADPFRTGEARMYRTGDLARYRADGNIECLGRIDHQVKIRGYRIELGEIEAALKEQPEIKQVVVIAREDRPGDKRLVAYLVATASTVPTTSELRTRLKRQLPDYMVPTAYVFLDQIPISTNGKIDRRALPLPAETQALQADTYIAPRSHLEEMLVGIWAEVLGVQQVGLDDDFFDLGGHSLVGVRLFAKIKKTYQVDLELAVLFEARTVRRLADVIRKAQQPAGAEQKTWPTLVPIQPDGSRIPFFCVHGVGGGVLNYEAIAKALGPDQPFYAFRSLLLTREDIPETTIEELASVYIKEMRSFFPQGPYLIGGGSFGGIVAFEMAQQLYAQGAEPALLVLFDTSAPGSAQRVGTTEKLRGFLQRLRDQGVPYLVRKVVLKGDDWRQRLVKRGRDVASFCYRLAGWDLPVRLRYYRVQEAHLRTMARYKIQTYPGKITLMRAVERGYLGMELLGTREDTVLGWENLAGGGLEIHDVPGEHRNMLNEPHVRIVAKELKTILPKPETIAPHRQPVA
jgi:amino acid adenylation domain-containing protein